MNFHLSARAGRILLQDQRYKRECRLVPKICKDTKAAQNQRAPPVPSEQEGIAKDPNCLCKWLSSLNLPSPPIRSKNPSVQRHSQVDPGIPQHQVRVPCQDEPHLNQSGRRQQQHPHTQTITAEVSEGGILQGAAEYQSFQRGGTLVWNASQGKATSDQLQLQQQLLLAEENSPAQKLWLLLNCPSQACLLWFSPQ